MTHFQLLQALAPLEHLISLNLYRTSVSQTALLAILCNNRDLENLNLSACPNIQGDEVFHLIAYNFQHQPHFHFLDHHTFTFQSKSQKTGLLGALLLPAPAHLPRPLALLFPHCSRSCCPCGMLTIEGC